VACLDTTVLVDLARPAGKWKRRALAKVRELVDRGEGLVTTRFNLAEMYVGVERSDDPDREERALQTVIEPLGMLDFDDRVARLFGQITAHLQTIGKPAGDMDVLIAATSMASGHALVTRNPAHFAGIPNLPVESY
jgi:predicted nucleic acid-binding protein